MLLDAELQHMPLAKLVGPKEQDRPREGTQQGREPAAVETAAHALLAKYFVVGSPQGRVFWRHVRVALLPGLDRVQRVHKHVAARAS